MTVREMLLKNYSFIFLSLVLLILICRNKNIKKQIRNFFFCFIGLSYLLVILDWLQSIHYTVPEDGKHLALIANLCYAIKPALLYIILAISEQQASKKLKIRLSLPLFLYYVLMLISFPWSLIVFYSQSNTFVNGPLISVTWIILLIYMGLILWSAFRKNGNSKDECFFLLFGESLILCNIISERLLENDNDMGNMVIILAALVYYLYLDARFEAKYRFEKEKELQQSRTQMMLSQIKPHFIYNSLACIAEICHEGLPEGEDAILTFSAYLRNCFRSCTDEGLIPFSEELNTIRCYVDLEKLHDPDKFTVTYEIGVSDFSVPIMSIETLVENAIKHGIRKKKGKGDLLIRTFSDGPDIGILIRDDGVGFEKTRISSDTTHLGLENARSRLKEQCNASLSVNTSPGQGTEILILFKNTISTGVQK